MAQDANYLRELLSLARMLRRFALEQSHDNHHVLFISTALALEARAHDLATRSQSASADLECERLLHAPVNCLI